MLTYDIRQLEQLEPFLAFVDALTKPEALKATIENLRTESAKYQELLGAFNTKKLAETEAHRILDEAEKNATKVREAMALVKIESDERQARLDEQEKAMAARREALSDLEKVLDKRVADVTARENEVHLKDLRLQNIDTKLGEWEKTLRNQANELAEKAEKIKALVG